MQSDVDLLVTTYGTLRRDIGWLADVPFSYAILDEAQAIKNPSSQSAKAVRLLTAERRLVVTGTPVENHLGELASLFDFASPELFGKGGLATALGAKRRPSPEEVRTVASALGPLMLRRTKEAVASELPAKTEQLLYCELDPAHRKIYDEIRDHYRTNLLSKVRERGLGRSKIQVLEALLRLRQASCHPELIARLSTMVKKTTARGVNRPKAGRKRKSQEVDDRGAKVRLLIDQIRELQDEGHKTLVFSQFTSFLAIVRRALDEEEVPYEYLDGRTRDRAAKVERFQTDDDCPVFLISLKAGGHGLNLTAADYVFLLDPWWNPAVEAQAIDRAHRIGQQRSVFAYRIIARDTVEEKVLELQDEKRTLAEAILSGAGESILRELDLDDLERLLG